MHCLFNSIGNINVERAKTHLANWLLTTYYDKTRDSLLGNIDTSSQEIVILICTIEALYVEVVDRQ